MLEKFKFHINNDLPFLKGGKILIAISGGMDSVVLSQLCREAGIDFSLAHCNFNLRGEESVADEQFIENLATEWGVELFVKHFETKDFAKKHKLSTQMAARNLRYNWFQELADQLGFDHILTAHHADDNLETFLINLSRGSGLDGLTGIPKINGKIIRPLLGFSHGDIEAYAIENALKWRHDSSNDTHDYLRNKLRHNVIPALKEINPSFLNNFISSNRYLLDASHIIDERIEAISEKVITKIEDESIHFNIKEILKISNYNAYVYQLLKKYNFKEWNDVYGLIHSQSGKQIYSDGYRLLKNRDELILTRRLKDDQTNESLYIHESDCKVEFSEGVLKFQEISENYELGRNIIFLDKDKLLYPLKLRGWMQGDYFYPLGLGGKKKLSKYFKDEKMSLIDKENTKLLCSNEEILWVIGKRMDERFKITDATKRILRIEFIENIKY